MDSGKDYSKVQELDKKVYSVKDVCQMLNIGKSAAYALVNSGCFKTVRIGSSIRISKKSFDEWLDTL